MSEQKAFDCCGLLFSNPKAARDHSWMRVTRTYWWPEEETKGPCEGAKDA